MVPFIDTHGSNMPEESKYHFANIDHVVCKWKLTREED